MRAAKVATHFDLALLGDDAFHLFGAQAADHVAHTLAVAAACKARSSLADEGHKTRQRLLPIQAVQNGFCIQTEQLFALDAFGQDRNAAEVLALAQHRFTHQRIHLPSQIALALDGQSLNQQACSDFVIGRQHQHRVQLLGLQHVVLQHFADVLQLFTPVAKQRHHALVRLLARQAVLRVEGDRATAFVFHVDHLAQGGVVGHLAHLGAGGAQAQIRLHLDHAQLDRSVPKNLQHQSAIELDVALHQHARCGHLAQQLAHGRGVGTGFGVGSAPRQNILPGVGQAHQHAAHRQAFENEFMEFGQSAIDGPVGPILKS